MGKRSSRELVQRIARALSSNPQSVQDISKKIDADHTSVAKYLESLAETDVIKTAEKDGKDVFYLPENVKSKEGTYFGLPIEPEKEKQLHSLFALIEDLWKEKTGSSPSKTQVQKSAVHVVNSCGLDIPCGWYLYGSITVGAYHPGTEYEQSSALNVGDVRDTAEEAVDIFSEPENHRDIRLKQYRDEGKDLYLVKEQILALLADHRHPHNNPSALEREIEEFIVHLPKIDDPEAEEAVTEFAAIAPRLLRSAEDKEDITQYCSLITDAFHQLWDMIALYEFYWSMEEESYDQSTLDALLMSHLEERKEDAITALSNMADMLPKQKEPDNPYYQKLKEFKGSVEPREDEPEKDEESDIFGEFGVK